MMVTLPLPIRTELLIETIAPAPMAVTLFKSNSVSIPLALYPINVLLLPVTLLDPAE
jgi:hypothetical protein